MEVTWTAFKSFVVARSLSIQWVDDAGSYYLFATDSSITLQCVLNKANANDDLADFETNFKALGNQKQTLQFQPFAAKSLPNGKKLFARNIGFQSAVVVGPNTITYTITFPWSKLIGVEVINSEALDTVDFKVYDSALGSYSGVPNALLNQFGYATNLPKDYYVRLSNYDADVYIGMVFQITYTSLSDKTVGFNLILNEVKS